MSISDNNDLAELVEKAKSLAGDVTVKSLKQGTNKADFKAKLTEVGESLAKFTTTASIRKFTLED